MTSCTCRSDYERIEAELKDALDRAEKAEFDWMAAVNECERAGAERDEAAATIERLRWELKGETALRQGVERALVQASEERDEQKMLAGHAEGGLYEAERERDEAHAERDAFKAALDTASRAIERRDREADALSGFIEACDAVGAAIARAEGRPYDRATCWGEPTLYLAERVRRLLGEED